MVWIESVRSMRVPDGKGRRERDGEHGRAEIEADLEPVGQRVGDLRADHADQHDGQPVAPGHVLARAQLQQQGHDQQTRP